MAKLRYIYDRSAGLRAGVDLPESILVEAPAASLSEEMRDLLSRVRERDGARDVETSPKAQRPAAPSTGFGEKVREWAEIPGEPILSSDPQDVLAALEGALATWCAADNARREAKVAEESRRLREAEEKFLAAPAGAWVKQQYPSDPWRVCGPDPIGYAKPNADSPVYVRWLEEEADALRRTEAYRREVEESNARLAAEEAAKREAEGRLLAAKRALLRSYVDMQGSPSQKARVAMGASPLGRLPEKEAEDCLRDYLFAEVDGTQHGKIRAADVRAECPDHDEYGADGKKVEFFSEDPTELTEEEFLALERGKVAVEDIRAFDVVRAFAGDVHVTADVREHIGRWDCGDDAHEWHMIVRPTLRIVVEFSTPDGPCATFSREFAV